MENGFTVNGKKKNIAKDLCCYTIAFAITFLAVMGWLLVQGKSLCWDTDAIAHYIPKAYYYIEHGHEFLQNLLAGHPSLQMYDFTLGLGDMVPLHLEPVYWLYLLTDPKNIEVTFTVLMVLRFYLGGLTCFFLLKYFQTESYAAILGSMIYLFSGFGTWGVLRHNQFMVPMILLPLLIMAMEELLWKKKWYYFTVTVFICIWCGYYFTFMNTILVGIYFLVRFFCTKEERTVKEFFIKGIRITYSYTIGILIGNITFFTSFAGYLGSSRTGTETDAIPSMVFYGKNWAFRLFKAFLSSADNPGKWVKLGFIAVCYLAVMLLWVKRGKVYLHLKLLFLALTAGLLIPAFGYVMSGFSNGNNRWCFGYALLIAVITARMIPELIRLSKKECIYLFLTILPYEAISVKYLLIEHKGPETIYAGAFLLLAYLVVVLISQIPERMLYIKKAVMSVLVIGLLSNMAYHLFDPSQADYQSEFINAGKVYESITNTPLVASDQIEDDTFYRSATYNNSSKNIGSYFVLGNQGLLYFNSTINGNILDFCRETGLTTFSLVRLQDFNERAFLNSLLSVKYLLLDKKQAPDRVYGYDKGRKLKANKKKYFVYENQYALPFGVTYDKIISVDDLERYDFAERAEVMLSAAAVEEEAIVNTKDKLPVTGKKLQIKEVIPENVEVDEHHISAKKGGSLLLLFDAAPENELYLYVKNMKLFADGRRTFSWKCGEFEESRTLHGDRETYYTDQADYLFNMYYSEKERDYCRITFTDAMELTFDELSVYEQPLNGLASYTEDRTREVLEDVTFTEDAVSGTITVSDDKLLMMQIPYQNGWTAYVDGEKTPMIKTNLMFTGLWLSKGTHQVELRYEIPGFKLSLLISAAGVLIFIGLLIVQFRYKKRKTA